MNNFTIVTIIFLLHWISTNINAQEIAPLGFGNRWIFEGDILRLTDVDTNYVIDTISYHCFTVQNTNGFEYSRYTRLTDIGYYAVRLDTSYPTTNHEKLYYKKDAIIGDTWENPGEYFPMVYTIVDTFSWSVFGQTVTVKRLDIDASLIYFIEYWTEEFGVLSRTEHPLPSTMYNLKGCVIDGIVYGDTSFVVTVAEELELVKDFNLEQNYPNPFNPSTTISYSIPGGGNVKLTVYNSLGEKTCELMNEWQSIGNYIVDFTADNISGGIYFYVLQYKNNIQTKKMVLLR